MSTTAPSTPTLSPEQMAVVLDGSPALLVDAGAGTGKTTVIVESIAHALGIGSVSHPEPDPFREILSLDQVVAITFTRKAAAELKDRLRTRILQHAASIPPSRDRERWAEVAHQVDRARISTIDAFASTLIRECGPVAGYASGISLMEPGDAAVLIRRTASEALRDGLDRGQDSATALVRHFGSAGALQWLCDVLHDPHALGQAVDALAASARPAGPCQGTAGAEAGGEAAGDMHLRALGGELLAFAVEVHERLVGEMAARGSLDHARLLLRALEVAGAPEAVQVFRERTRLLFVDEHQDTSPAQYALITRLTANPIPNPGPGAGPNPGPDAGPNPGSDAGPNPGSGAGSGAGPATGLSVGPATGPEPRGAPDSGATPSPLPPVRVVYVGDPQQGIYGFRGADISIWGETREAVIAQGGSVHTLGTTHRTHPGVTVFLDHVLGRVMSPPQGKTAPPHEVPYRPLASGRRKSIQGSVELLLSRAADARGHERTSLEAEMVARRVEEMLNDPSRYPVMEMGPDGVEVERPVQAKDIAILSRKVRGVGATYEAALRRRGIGAHVLGGRGIFQRQEIQDLVALIRAVSDSTDLAAVLAWLRSPLGGVDDRTILELRRAAAPTESLLDHPAVDAAVDAVRDREGRARAREARRVFVALRELQDRIPHADLIERAMDMTGYRAFLAGAPDAPAGLQNIEKLIRIARRSRDHETLARFAESLQERMERADPEEEAPLYASGEDLVTISSIHKAKGLEWPVVILTGIADAGFHRIPTSLPRLDDSRGIVLPIEVHLEGAGQGAGHDADQDLRPAANPRQETPTESEAASGAAPDPGIEILPTAAWDAHVEEASRRLYAESKRLFYVACTRARDRLILAGCLRYDTRPAELQGKVGGLSAIGPEWWLRHIFPGITKEGATDGRNPTTIALGGTGTVAVEWVEPETLMDSVGRGLWPHAPSGINPVVGVAPDPEASVRMAPVHHLSRGRAEFSVSEIITARRCENLHYLRFRAGISRPTLHLGPDAPELSPSVRGDILHAYLAGAAAVGAVAESSDEARARMASEVRRFTGASGEEAVGLVEELTERANTFLAGPLGTRLRRATRVHTEVPFALSLTGDTRVRGQIDLLFQEADGGWVVVDYKSGTLPRGREARERALAERRKRYAPQAALYVMAAHEALGVLPEFHFAFLDAGCSRAIEPTEAWVEAQREELISVVRRIQAQVPPRELEYVEDRCSGCPLIGICQPAGAPDGTEGWHDSSAPTAEHISLVEST